MSKKYEEQPARCQKSFTNTIQYTISLTEYGPSYLQRLPPPVVFRLQTGEDMEVGIPQISECRDRRWQLSCVHSAMMVQGVTFRCRLSWLNNSALVYEPEQGGGEGVAGSQPVQLYTGPQINFGYLTPYLTYICDGYFRPSLPRVEVHVHCPPPFTLYLSPPLELRRHLKPVPSKTGEI
jgi:hypothetical protein